MNDRYQSSGHMRTHWEDTVGEQPKEVPSPHYLNWYQLEIPLAQGCFH